MGSRRQILLVVLLSVAALLCASMLAPAFGAPKAVSAASLASKLAKTLKIAKRADKNSKRALAGLQVDGARGPQGPVGPTGPGGQAGPAGPKGDAGATGAKGAQGANGANGAKGDACLSTDPDCQGPEGPKGDTGPACDPDVNSACRGPKGDTGPACDPDVNSACRGPKGDTGPACDPDVNSACRGPQGNPGAACDPDVNSACRGPQGNPGPAGPGAVMLNVPGIPNPSSTDVPAAGFTLRLNCGGSPTFRTFTVEAVGSGRGEIAGVKSISQAAVSDARPPNAEPFTNGASLSGELATIGSGSPFAGNTRGFQYRLSGTMVLHNASRVTTVVFDMFLNGDDAGPCFFRGTATPST